MGRSAILIRPLVVLILLSACGACAARYPANEGILAEGRVVDLSELSAVPSDRLSSAGSDARVVTEPSQGFPWFGKAESSPRQTPQQTPTTPSRQYPAAPPLGSGAYPAYAAPARIPAGTMPDRMPPASRPDSMSAGWPPESGPREFASPASPATPGVLGRGSMITQTAGEFAIEPPPPPPVDPSALYPETPPDDPSAGMQGMVQGGPDAFGNARTAPYAQPPPLYPSMSASERAFDEIGKIRDDYRNYYTCRTLLKLTVGFSLGAIPANTAMDVNFRNWYQDDVRSRETDRVADFFRPLGEGMYVVPAYLGVGVASSFFADTPCGGELTEFGYRSTRAYLVGAPPMLFMQYATGGGRPLEHSVGSQWRPFQDCNSVSGHAFMGAVPFITAAKMSDGILLKSLFYFGSTMTAWSRVNDDRHYLSQICLGWWMAYLACESVELTETQRESQLAMMPLIAPDVVGVSLLYRR